MGRKGFGMFVIKRKQIIVCCLAVLVATAGYLNFTYGRDRSEEVAKNESVGEIHLVEEEGDFFEAARLEREINRAEVKETLSTIIENESSEVSSKAMAEEEVIKVSKIQEQEQLCESLIKAKGYADAVVYINEDKVNAVVKAESLTPEDATKIAEIITEQTRIPATGIKITQSE